MLTIQVTSTPAVASNLPTSPLGDFLSADVPNTYFELYFCRLLWLVNLGLQ